MKRELQQYIESDEALSLAWQGIGLAGYRGSLAHGTHGDVLDDIDIMGVFVAPRSHYFGLSSFEGVERPPTTGKYDVVLYEVRKFVRLLLKGNPNVLSLLWLNENMYLVKTWGERLVESRHLFMGKHLYKSFGGYAYSQLHKMTHGQTGGFMGAKRREKFKQFGYDCKNASHLIRLLRTGIEALSTGEINVHRHDAQQLREIKEGLWTKGQVEREAERLRQSLDEALVSSVLSSHADHKKAEILLMEILEEGLRKNT